MEGEIAAVEVGAEGHFYGTRGAFRSRDARGAPSMPLARLVVEEYQSDEITNGWKVEEDGTILLLLLRFSRNRTNLPDRPTASVTARPEEEKSVP